MRFFRKIGGLTGWRRFGFEVAIIVFGVGLALLADQAITSLNRKGEIRQAMDAVNSDLALNYIYASERLAVEPCRRQQIEALLERVDGDGEGWTAGFSSVTGDISNPMILDPVLRTPIRNWNSSAWQALLVTDVAIHMDRDTFAELSGIFDVIVEMRGLQNEALPLKGALAYLAEPGELTPEEKRAAKAAIGRVAALEGLISIHAVQTLQRLIELDVPVRDAVGDAGEFSALVNAVNASAAATYGPCFDRSAYDPLLAALAGEAAPAQVPAAP